MRLTDKLQSSANGAAVDQL